MASGLPMLLAAFLTLLSGSTAASIYTDKEGVVRREQRANMHLSAKAELVRSEKKPRTMVKDVENDDAIGWLANPRMVFGITTQLNLTDAQILELSRYDFTTGKEATSECTHPDNEVLIRQVSECIFAAEQSGAHLLDMSKFEIRNGYGDWVDRHPKGCFKDTCSEAAAAGKTVCYFDNLKAGGMPTGNPTMTGTPICQRPRFLMAEKDTNGGCDKVGGTGAGTDKGGYKTLMDESLCMVEGPLNGVADAHQFRVGIQNASEHLVHPEGCFLNEKNNMTYFNPPIAGTTVPATGVIGIQICNVTSVVKWPAA